MSEQPRVAIVTGAAGGIGRELVLGLLRKEIQVAAVDRTAQGLAELAQAAQERRQRKLQRGGPAAVLSIMRRSADGRQR